MRTISYTDARQNLSATMVQTVGGGTPSLIARQSSEVCADVAAGVQCAGGSGRPAARSSQLRRLMDSMSGFKRDHGVEWDIAEHRFVYSVTDEVGLIAACRYHY